MSNIGIFFLINNKLLVDTVNLAQAKPYDQYLEHGGHYDYWLHLRPTTTTEYLFKSRAYDAFPRGRVVFMPTQKRFVLYADNCIKRTQMLAIAKAFSIHKTQLLLMRDEHYQCAACNPYFFD